MADDVLHLAGGEIGEDGHDHRAHGGDGEIGHAPLRLVFAEDRHAVAGEDALFQQLCREQLHLLKQRLIGEDHAVHHAQRRPLGPGRSRVFEKVVQCQQREFRRHRFFLFDEECSICFNIGIMGEKDK